MKEGKDWTKDETTLTMLTHAAFAITAVVNLGLRMPWGQSIPWDVEEKLDMSWLPWKLKGEPQPTIPVKKESVILVSRLRTLKSNFNTSTNKMDFLSRISLYWP